MRSWQDLGRLPSWSAVAAVAVVMALLVFLALVLGGLQSGSSGAQGGPEMTRAELRTLTVGGSRDEVERAVGKGEDALEFWFGGTGTALEPMDASCVYYAVRGGPDAGPIQLCYRDDRLVSKRLYR